MPNPSLRFSGTSKPPSAVVLFLHGGQQRNHKPVMRRHASWARMAVMQRSFDPFAKNNNLAVALLKYRVRGWNATPGAEPDPVQDARWAIGELRDRFGPLPIVLVGHSMGGRTACHVADAEGVVGVCALAPWLPQGEPVAALEDRAVSVAHGTADKWTSAKWSEDYVRRACPIATQAAWTSISDAGHFMLSRVREWDGFVRTCVADMLQLPAEMAEDEA